MGFSVFLVYSSNMQEWSSSREDTSKNESSQSREAWDEEERLPTGSDLRGAKRPHRAEAARPAVSNSQRPVGD